MESMESTGLRPESRPPAPTAAQVLKLVGAIIILTYIIDFLVLLIAPQFSDLQWQLSTMTQLIDRGILPLIGFALIYAGFWVQTSAGAISALGGNHAAWQDSRFWTFVFASLLGLLFILLIPLHFSATGQLSQQALERVNQQIAQAEVQLDQDKRQLQEIANSGQLDQLLSSNQLPAEQLALLQQVKQDPQAIEKRVAARQQEIQQQKTQLTKQTNQEALLTRLRSEIRSFFLAIGFITVGWSGLRESR